MKILMSIFEREVEPYVENAWINDGKKYHDDQDGGLGIVGYEINLNEYFYNYNPPRSLEEIDRDLQNWKKKIAGQIGEITQ